VTFLLLLFPWQVKGYQKSCQLQLSDASFAFIIHKSGILLFIKYAPPPLRQFIPYHLNG